MAKGAKTGGRKKGVRNKRTVAQAVAVKKAGLTPLEFMMKIMRDLPPADADALTIVRHQELQFEAAKAAAPYVHPKLTSVEHKGEGGGPLKAEISVRFV